MKVNYLLEINRLHRWEMTNPLKPAEFKLLMKLLDLANSQDFPEELRVTCSRGSWAALNRRCCGRAPS